jgi:hypothetical protein
LNTRHVFAVTIEAGSHTGQLLWFDPKLSNWKALGERFSLRRTQPSQENFNSGPSIWPSMSLLPGGGCVDGDDGLAVFLRTSGPSRTMEFFDANTGSSAHLLDLQPEELGSCAFRTINGIDGLVLRFFDIKSEDTGFIYKPGGELQKVSLQGQALIYLSADGSSIYRRQYIAQDVFYRSAAGKERRLWPTQ